VLLFFVEPAFAMGGGAEGASAANPIAQLAPFILMFIVLWFLILRPQVKKQKAHTICENHLTKNLASV